MQLMLSPQRNRRRRGSAILEGALILLPTLAMILFILDMGIILVTEQYYMERARAGARYAATASYDATAIKNIVCYNSTTAPNGNPGLFNLSPSMVNVSRLGTAGDWDDRIQVRISGYTMFSFIPWLSGSFTGKTLTATTHAQSLGATN